MERFPVKGSCIGVVTEADLVDGVHPKRGGPEIVELTAAVALENFRSKFNVTLGIEAQGFCLLEDRRQPTLSEPH